MWAIASEVVLLTPFLPLPSSAIVSCFTFPLPLLLQFKWFSSFKPWCPFSCVHSYWSFVFVTLKSGLQSKSIFRLIRKLDEWLCLALHIMDIKHGLFEEWVDSSSSFSSDSSWTSFDLSTDLTSVSSEQSVAPVTAPGGPFQDRLPKKCRPVPSEGQTGKAEWRETSFLNK